MGQGVHQSVAVPVHGAVHDVSVRAAGSDQKVQADLCGGHQLGRLDDHDESHLPKEFLVDPVGIQIMDLGTGDDADIQIVGIVRLLASELAGLPESRDARHFKEAFFAPA